MPHLPRVALKHRWKKLKLKQPRAIETRIFIWFRFSLLQAVGQMRGNPCRAPTPPRLPVELPQPVHISFANLIVCASVDCDCDCALACTSSKWLCAPAPASACSSACRWFSVARVAAAAVTDWQQFSFALFFGRIFPAFHSFNWKRLSRQRARHRPRHRPNEACQLLLLIRSSSRKHKTIF